MATETDAQAAISAGGKKRKHRYLPHNKPVKKKGAYPLRPGVQGFFITCDGGKERQASHEAINVIDSFFDDLVDGKDSSANVGTTPDKPINKKIKFTYSDSSGSEEEDDDDENEGNGEEAKVNETEIHAAGDTSNECQGNGKSDCHKTDDVSHGDTSTETTGDIKEDVRDHDGGITNETAEPPAKKQCSDANKSEPETQRQNNAEKSIDKLIEAEIQELGDKNKRRFSKLDSGCNGVAFVQMRRRDGDPSPKDIVQRIMESAAATRKHMSRFILRVLPVEVACYASEEEISRAIKPIISQYFPAETETPVKFAVLYDARANTGIERMKIIDAVAKSVPAPHKVDLKNPEKSIVVQIVKTVCLIGVVEKYKELAKYNLRQLTSTQA